MRSVGIKILKNKLSQYIQLAVNGEVILICNNDKVVAELRPASQGRSELLGDALLMDVIREGLISPALQPHLPVHELSRPLKFSDLLTSLEQDRADR